MRRAPHSVNLARDGRAVNDFQRVQRLAGRPQLAILRDDGNENGRVKDQQVFQKQANPLLPAMFAVRIRKEICEL